jgi:hypothetical protein
MGWLVMSKNHSLWTRRFWRTDVVGGADHVPVPRSPLARLFRRFALRFCAVLHRIKAVGRGWRNALPRKYFCPNARQHAVIRGDTCREISPDFRRWSGA